MNKICRICKLEFKPEKEKTEVVVCGDCTSAIKEVLFSDSQRDTVLEMLAKDDNIKNRFLDILLTDKKVLSTICMKMFDIPVKEIGLGGSGSIADFFREETDS